MVLMAMVILIVAPAAPNCQGRMVQGHFRELLGLTDVEGVYVCGHDAGEPCMVRHTEAGGSRNEASRLAPSACGRRVTGADGKCEVARAMTGLGCAQSMGSPSVHHHSDKGSHIFIHGDGIAMLGGLEQLERFHTALAQECNRVVRAMSGPPGAIPMFHCRPQSCCGPGGAGHLLGGQPAPRRDRLRRSRGHWARCKRTCRSGDGRWTLWGGRPGGA